MASEREKEDRIWKADIGDGRYRNPVLYADYSDPDVIRVGDDYYMVVSSFCNAPAIPLLHSKDLVNWKVVNYVLKKLPFPCYDTPQHGRGVWAPSIRFREGLFFVCFPLMDEGIFMTTATDPLGEWSEPVRLRYSEKEPWFDPCPFWDEDGRAYLVAASRGGFLHLVEMQPDGMALIGTEAVIMDGLSVGHRTLEGPKLYKKDGWYYIFAPAGGVKMGWQTVLRAENIRGPYELKTVLMQGSTGINGPHQGAWVQTQTGEDWFIHFQDCYAAGRVVHLQPMMWKADGWPVIGHPVGGEEWGEPVPVCKKPDVGASYPPCAPDATDYFESGTLGLQWQWNANPKDGWAMFETGTRGLWMRAAALDPTLGKREQKLCHLPNLLLQKWPVPAFTCITTCDMSGLKPGDEAGVVSMGTYYCAVCAVCEEQHTSLWLVTGGRKDEMVEKRKKLLEAISDTLFVKYEVRPNGVHLRAKTKNAPLERITLSYSTDGTHYEQVHSEDSLQGFWVGTKSGVYALHRGPGEEGRMRVQSVVYEAGSGLE